MLIGREQEQKELLDLFKSDESEFCAVYGRRRIGKTYLVRETLNGYFAFQHTGVANAPMRVQLNEFRFSLKNAGHECPAFRDWYDAFHGLEEYLDECPPGKKVVFLDELSWMDTVRSNFLSALEHFWNGWVLARPQKDILLIVCGSATSWIINRVIQDHGGLHNRLTHQIYLRPFSLHECELLAVQQGLKYSRMDLAELYMIMGGVPYYWSFLHKTESVPQNIDRIFFAENAPLAHEFNALYASIFRKSAIHVKIVANLATRKAGMTRREILEATGLPANTAFSQSLEELEQCNFIRKYFTLGKKERDAVYQLMDNFTLFHFQYIVPNSYRNENFWSSSLEHGRHYAWRGLAFERLCLWHLPQIKRTLGISGIVSNAHSWLHYSKSGKPDAQIDLLLVRNDRIINLCEMKFSDHEYSFSKQEHENLMQRKHWLMEAVGKNYSVWLTAITAYGVAQNAMSNDFQSFVTLDDLFQA